MQERGRLSKDCVMPLNILDKREPLCFWAPRRWMEQVWVVVAPVESLIFGYDECTNPEIVS